jgi:hypothetical protein
MRTAPRTWAGFIISADFMSPPDATLSQQFANRLRRKAASIDAHSPLSLSDDKSRQVEARSMHKRDDCIRQLGSLDMWSIEKPFAVDGEKLGTNKILGRKS